MADLLVIRAAAALRRTSFHEYQHTYPKSIAEMSEPIPNKGAKPDPNTESNSNNLSPEYAHNGGASAGSSPPEATAPGSPSFLGSPSLSPRLSRNPSFSGSSSYQEDWEAFPPLDRMTVFELLDNFALPQQLEKFQNVVSAQTSKVRRQREALKNRSSYAKERVVEEWRKRVPPADEQLEKYRKRMRENMDKLGRRWNDTKAVTLREKLSFIGGVSNIFISGILIGGYPDYFHWWYTAQILYYMPLRGYTYHKRGYHYFLADLCYFVNFLLLLSLWVFPQSKRLLISTYCLAYGNNAVAIIMWRNSMVFHSLDKMTSLFIHIMPCVTLHVMVHLLPESLKESRFPAIYNIQNAPPGSPSHYSLLMMTLWSTIPYAVWQLGYHFLITVRRREKIAAGRPTSFTWLRKSYSKAWIGKLVISLPESLQEPAFMLIQYFYAVLTMVPCPIWFWYRYPSVVFLCAVFGWSIYNGATYYIDVFGNRFQKELEEMKREVAKWQHTPDGAMSPIMTPLSETGNSMADGNSHMGEKERKNHQKSASVDKIPLLNDEGAGTGIDGGARDVARERKIGDLPA